MEMKTRKIDDILIVQPMVKRIDSASAADFKATIVDYINNGNMKIVLNLANVDFIDSTGLGMIISTLKSLGSNGGMSICCLSNIVNSLFTLTRMNKVFEITLSEEEAIEKAKAKG